MVSGVLDRERSSSGHLETDSCVEAFVPRYRLDSLLEARVELQTKAPKLNFRLRPRSPRGHVKSIFDKLNAKW